MKYGAKEELTRDMAAQYAALIDMLKRVPPARYKERGVWGDDWTIHDLLAHLVAWHGLFLT